MAGETLPSAQWTEAPTNAALPASSFLTTGRLTGIQAIASVGVLRGRIAVTVLSAIADLTATPVTGDPSVDLAWTPATNASSHQPQYRQQGASAWQNIGGIFSGTASSVTVTGLSGGITYEFRVLAYGTDTTPTQTTSNTVTGTTAATLAQVTGLSATAASSSEINLAWTAVSGAALYRVQRKLQSEADGAFADVTTVTGTTLGMFGLPASTGYSFRVRAENGTVLGAYSTTASATTAGTTPAAMSALLVGVQANAAVGVLEAAEEVFIIYA